MYLRYILGSIHATNRDLYESEREVRRLRKAIADHCVVQAGSNGWNREANGIVDSERTHESLEKGIKGRRESRDAEKGSVWALKR